MAWNDKPLGVVIDERAAQVNFKQLASEGLKFVVISIGTGLTKDTRYAQHVDAAYRAGLPILLMYTPYPEIYNHSADKVITEQFEFVKTLLVNKAFQGIVVNAERWWRDEDPSWKATSINISNTYGDIANKLNVAYPDKVIMVRTSDHFVKTYSPEMSNWIHNFDVLLADWRVRYKFIINGVVTNLYVNHPTTSLVIAGLGDIRKPDDMVPQDARDAGSTALIPPIPGNNSFALMWEFTGLRYRHPAIMGNDLLSVPSNFILSSIALDSLYNHLDFVTVVDDPVDPDPGDDDTDGGTVYDDEVLEFVERLDNALTAFAKAWLKLQ